MLERIRQTTESATLSSKQCDFLNDLENAEYRNLFAGELVGTGLAFQIRRLRDARGFTQDELAQLTDKKQETISQWENLDYGRYTLSTLKTLAGAFDVGLLVRFVSFSELADWTIDVNPRRLTPPSYAEESQLSVAAVHEAAAEWSEDVYFTDEDIERKLNLAAFSVDIGENASATRSFATADVETPQPVEMPRQKVLTHEAA